MEKPYVSVAITDGTNSKREFVVDLNGTPFTAKQIGDLISQVLHGAIDPYVQELNAKTNADGQQG